MNTLTPQRKTALYSDYLLAMQAFRTSSDMLRFCVAECERIWTRQNANLAQLQSALYNRARQHRSAWLEEGQAIERVFMHDDSASTPVLRPRDKFVLLHIRTVKRVPNYERWAEGMHGFDAQNAADFITQHKHLVGGNNAEMEASLLTHWLPDVVLGLRDPVELKLSGLLPLEF